VGKEPTENHTLEISLPMHAHTTQWRTNRGTNYTNIPALPKWRTSIL